MKTVLIGYEPSHADLLAARAHEGSIVAFDKELEWKLEKLGVPFVSSRDYRTGAQAHNLALAGDVAEHLYGEDLSWLSYRGIALADVYSFKVQVFFQKIFYFGEVLHELLRREDPSRVRICAPSSPVGVTENPLLYWEARVAIEALNLLRGDCPMDIIAVSGELRQKKEPMPFLVSVGFLALDLVTRLLPRKRMRILVADHWRNIGEVFRALPQSELLFYDRRELGTISFQDLLRHRIRFVRRPPLPVSVESQAKKFLHRIQEKWLAVRERVVHAPFEYKKHPLGPLFAAMLDDVIAHQTQKTITEIEQIFLLLERTRPHIIFLRTTIGGQSHFPLLAAIAKELSIPVIEVQHGLETFIDGTYSRRHRGQYMSAYGPLIKEEMQRAGQTTHLLEIGSPRMELLRPLPHSETGSFEVFCTAPDVAFSALFDTYDACDYFDAVSEAANRIPNAHVTIKLRSSSRWQGFYREAVARSFRGVSHTATKEDPLEILAARADVAITCYSTIALELMILRVPLIVLGLCPVEQKAIRAHFGPYVREGAIKEAYSAEECAQKLSSLSTPTERERARTAAQEFLNTHYLFDGKSSTRLAGFLHALAKG